MYIFQHQNCELYFVNFVNNVPKSSSSIKMRKETISFHILYETIAQMKQRKSRITGTYCLLTIQ